MTSTELYLNTAFNALNIAREMPDIYGKPWLAANSITSDGQARLAQAAAILTEIEFSPAWSWDEQSNDYETACAYIAKLVAGRKPITTTAVLANIQR